MIPVSNSLTHSMFALLNLTLEFLFVSRQVDLRPRTVRRDAERLSKLEHEPPQSPHPSPSIQLTGGNRQIRTTPPASGGGAVSVIAGSADVECRTADYSSWEIGCWRRISAEEAGSSLRLK